MRWRGWAISGLAIAMVLAVAGLAIATPPSNVTPTLLGAGTFAGDIKVQQTHPADVQVVNLTFAPGGHTGWHSHPGPTVIMVKSGTLDVFTVLSDGACAKRTYTAGEGFVELPKDTQTTRNPSATETTTIVVVFFNVPMGGSNRIDRPDPGCDLS